MTTRLNAHRVRYGKRESAYVTADLLGAVLSLTLPNGEVLLLDATQLLGFLMSPEHDEEAA